MIHHMHDIHQRSLHVHAIFPDPLLWRNGLVLIVCTCVKMSVNFSAKHPVNWRGPNHVILLKDAVTAEQGREQLWTTDQPLTAMLIVQYATHKHTVERSSIAENLWYILVEYYTVGSKPLGNKEHANSVYQALSPPQKAWGRMSSLYTSVIGLNIWWNM